VLVANVFGIVCHGRPILGGAMDVVTLNGIC
jgi:hypothetical protein